MSVSCSGDIGPASAPHAMTQSFDSPGLMYAMEKRDSGKEKEREKVPDQIPSKPVNHSLEAASKMVPVPESLMSPDYQDPMYDIQRGIPKPHCAASVSNSSPSSTSSVHEDRPHRQIVQPNKNLKGSPKLPKSATSSPKLRSKMERKSSLSKAEAKGEQKLNGLTKQESADQMDPDKLEIIKLASNQRRARKMSAECMAAVTIQKMWRGYRSRNLNKDTLRILHAIQAARARQHIQRLTCDMEATKAALESERKIQQLQMQAINALWKKVSTLQANDTHAQRASDSEDSTAAVRLLTETCGRLQEQVEELQGCMRDILRCVACSRTEPTATQTDITAVLTPQEERCTWLRRPQSLPLAAAAPAAPPPVQDVDTLQETNEEKSNEMDAIDIERTESIIEEKTSDQSLEAREQIIVD